MGQAIIIKNIDFSSFNIGTVHKQGQPIPVTGISILGSSIVTNSATYNVSYIPSNTTQLGVTWSIISGSIYASIDSQTGELTVLEGASSNNVKIRATSIFNQSVYGELDVIVSYVVHDCSMEISLINGDFTLHDWDNGVDIEPDHAGYLASNENGTSFNRTLGHGILYDNFYNDIKSYSFESYFDEVKTGSLSNSWGGIFSIYNAKTGGGNSVLTLNKYPDDAYRLAVSGDVNSANLNTKVHANLGAWHKICVVSNFSPQGYVASLFIDGEKLGSTGPASVQFLGEIYNLVIGNSWRLKVNGYSATDVNPICGTIRNARLFRRELTNEEAIQESTLN